VLRSLLLALDGSFWDDGARRYAVALAQRHDADVLALGLAPSDDHAGLIRKEGSLQDKRSLQAIGGAGRERIDGLLGSLEHEGESSGRVRVERRVVASNPVESMRREAAAHDLLVIGRDSHPDRGNQRHDLPLWVGQVVRDEARPVLLVLETIDCEPGGDLDAPVLVSFDGSAAASRALHMFALLGLGRGREVHILTVDETSEATAGETAAQAAALLRRHGVADPHCIALSHGQAGRPAEAILETASAVSAGLIVMGAYGRRGIRELFGSCTQAVLDSCPKSMFLHH
jgi:nucleotide-binding universal stress UspA family protein